LPDKDGVKSLLDILGHSKQFRVVEMLAQGLSNKQIAAQLGTTEGVIKNYMRAILDETGCWSRMEVAVRYLSEKQQGKYAVR
jgi:DNA-binding NarL/FixJ family response regulator